MNTVTDMLSNSVFKLYYDESNYLNRNKEIGNLEATYRFTSSVNGLTVFEADKVDYYSTMRSLKKETKYLNLYLCHKEFADVTQSNKTHVYFKIKNLSKLQLPGLEIDPLIFLNNPCQDNVFNIYGLMNGYTKYNNKLQGGGNIHSLYTFLNEKSSNKNKNKKERLSKQSYYFIGYSSQPRCLYYILGKFNDDWYNPLVSFPKIIAITPELYINMYNELFDNNIQVTLSNGTTTSQNIIQSKGLNVHFRDKYYKPFKDKATYIKNVYCS